MRSLALERMINSSPQTKPSPETSLQRTLNAALNDIGTDAALAAIFHQENGPLVEHASRGFTPRDVQAILRTLSTQRAAALTSTTHDPDGGHAVRLRLITPGAKSLLVVPLRHFNSVYGCLVIGRKEGAAFSKKDKLHLEQMCDGMTKALDREGLFNTNAVLSRSYVTQEPGTPHQTGADLFPPMIKHFSPELQEKIEEVLTEADPYVSYDRAWACYYDPLAGNVEVLGITGDVKTDPKDAKKDLKPGQRLTLDSSAAGWAVRHRKPRVDHDLASTQGRFLDHKHLFKDRFQSSLVIPFFRQRPGRRDAYARVERTTTVSDHRCPNAGAHYPQTRGALTDTGAPSCRAFSDDRRRNTGTQTARGRPVRAHYSEARTPGRDCGIQRILGDGDSRAARVHSLATRRSDR